MGLKGILTGHTKLEKTSETVGLLHHYGWAEATDVPGLQGCRSVELIFLWEMPYSNSAQAFGAVTVKTFQLKFELQTKENPVPFYDVNPQLFTHMEESGVFNNKMIIYV